VPGAVRLGRGARDFTLRTHRSLCAANTEAGGRKRQRVRRKRDESITALARFDRARPPVRPSRAYR
jgi:hypothetical protein